MCGNAIGELEHVCYFVLFVLLNLRYDLVNPNKERSWLHRPV